MGHFHSKIFRRETKIERAYVVQLTLVVIGGSIRATKRSKDGGTDCIAAPPIMGKSDFHVALAVCLDLRGEDLLDGVSTHS